MSRNLQEWLLYQEQIHPESIELGLDRVAAVYLRLGIEKPAVTITVAGTNGKGSCIAYMESALLASGCSVAAYTSPHLLHYSERLRIDGSPLTEADWCAAFEKVEAVRGDVSLTYFEFGTLAALWLAAHTHVDCQLLEVGLGGRLDAVNILDADVAVVTSIGTDHSAWLGTGREAIAVEKAGIFRPGRPAVCGDPVPPASLLKTAESVGADLYCIGEDFWVVPEANGSWLWAAADNQIPDIPALSGAAAAQYQNAAAALMALQLAGLMQSDAGGKMACALAATRIRARAEIHEGAVTRIFDVAHNAEACQVLADTLAAWRARQPGNPRIHAVFSALSDKPIAEMCDLLAPQIHAWYVGGLSGLARGLTAGELVAKMPKVSDLYQFSGVGDAWQAASAQASPGDAIIAFGSFHTLSEVLADSHE